MATVSFTCNRLLLIIQCQKYSNSVTEGLILVDTARKNFIIAAEDVTTRIGTLKNTILDTGNLKSAEISGNWAFLHSTIVDDSSIFLIVDNSSIFLKRRRFFQT